MTGGETHDTPEQSQKPTDKSIVDRENAGHEPVDQDQADTGAEKPVPPAEQDDDDLWDNLPL